MNEHANEPQAKWMLRVALRIRQAQHASDAAVILEHEIRARKLPIDSPESLNGVS